MMEHTPGPWEVEMSHSDDLYRVTGMAIGSKCPINIVTDVREANAKLIAAAPEMLKIIKHLIEQVEEYPVDCEHVPEAFDMARDLIDKMKEVQS